MPVGDVNSDLRGSGARYNDNKPKMEYVPARVVLGYLRTTMPRSNILRERVLAIMDCVAEFEEGANEAVHEAMTHCGDHLWNGSTAQFDFGAKKYAPFNWAKGMAWSIPLACIKRHILAIASGEEHDRESGVHHLGAVACNLIMLAHYLYAYEDGDDRPKELRMFADLGEVSKKEATLSSTTGDKARKPAAPSKDPSEKIVGGFYPGLFRDLPPERGRTIVADPKVEDPGRYRTNSVNWDVE